MSARVNPKQALWEALLVVALPSFVLSTVLWYWLGTAEELPFYLGLFVVPTVILLPLVYRKYRRGAQPVSAKRQTLAGILSLLAGAAYAVDAFLTQPDKWRLLLRFSIAIGWLAAGVLLLERARSAKLAQARSES